MCEIFDVKDPNTISRWRRDARVKKHTLPLAEDRIVQISRKIDSTIEARLQHTDKLSIKELLDIRKEFLGGALRAQTEKADDEVIGQAQTLLEENPDAVKKFLEALDEPVPANV
jgi:transposase-like protein